MYVVSVVAVLSGQIAQFVYDGEALLGRVGQERVAGAIDDDGVHVGLGRSFGLWRRVVSKAAG